MRSRWLGAGCVLFALAAAAAHAGRAPTVDVKVTHHYLQPLCLNGTPVKANKRRWQVPVQSQTLTFTMKNEPREPVPQPVPKPGIAVVRFTPQPGHRYEVEVRAPLETYSARVWEKGKWAPVVRDRTLDSLVSSEPEWIETGCGPR